MLNEITQQWQSWISSPSARRTYRRWTQTHPELQAWDLQSLGEPAFGAIELSGIDKMQSALIDLSQDGCQRATLAITCQMLPGLRKLARTTAKGFQEPEAEVISAFYEVLVMRNLEKRPSKVAANLLLDTKQKVYRLAKKDMRQFQIIDDIQGAIDWAATSTENSINSIWTMSLMNSALDTYSKPNERELVGQIAFAHWIEGRPTKVISDSLNLSPTAVTTKLWRFKNKIRVMGEADMN